MQGNRKGMTKGLFTEVDDAMSEKWKGKINVEGLRDRFPYFVLQQLKSHELVVERLNLG